MKPSALYEFGQFRLDREARILLRDGKIVPLTPKVLDLLLVLVEKRGQLLAKENLMKAVWPDTFVEDGNLTSNISILRKELGAPPGGGEYIETIPKRGYRFVAAVAEVSDGASSGAPAAARPAVRSAVLLAAGGCVAAALLVVYWTGWYRGLPGFPDRTRIEALAVLPLENLSGDPAQDYFADGITEALTANLAQIGALRVISRTSVMQYKGTKRPLPEIAGRLKVDAVILGSVLRSGQRVRITAELIYASTDRHLWARTYERELGDILDLQNEVARAIANEVHVKLTAPEKGRLGRSRMVNPGAYEAYLKGRYHWSRYTEESLLKSIEYFEQAIKLDPGYAPPHAGLADAWLGLGYIGARPPEEVHPQALEAASKALAMDDALAEAHAAIGVLKALEWDWTATEREARRAIELNPGYALAHSFYSNQLRHLGRKEESIAEARRALELDPLSPMTNEGLADAYLSARQYDLAVEQYQKTLDLHPHQAASQHALAWAYVYKGMYGKGIEEMRKSAALYREDLNLSPDLAYIYAVSGRSPEAQRILGRLLRISKQAPVAPGLVALIYVGLGNREEAFSWLERAYQQRSPMMAWLKVDPRFDSLRSDPRFQDLMRRVGLA